MMDLGVKTKGLNLLRELLKNELNEELLYKLVRGHRVTDLISKIVPNHYQYPKNSLRKVQRGKFQYELDLSDLMDWHLFYGFVEPSTETLVSLCKPGSVVFDIGSNIGAILLRFSEAAGANGQIYGFEPFPSLYKKCLHNLNINQIKNVKLNDFALGEYPHSANIKICDPHNQGKNRISKNVAGSDCHFSIQVKTLDNYVAEQDIKKIDLMKLDVEGYELKVLLGASQTLKKFHPQLFIEVDENNLKEQGHTPQELMQFLEQHSYAAYEVLSKKQMTSDSSFKDCHIDIIAYHLGN